MTFEHGILVFYSAYHAIYSGMLLFKIIQGVEQPVPAAKQKFRQRDLILPHTISKKENALYL
jgi:hypothetical protein